MTEGEVVRCVARELAELIGVRLDKFEPEAEILAQIGQLATLVERLIQLEAAERAGSS